MNETDVFNALKYRTYNVSWQAYEWHNDAGQYHRSDGPAVEWDDGGKEWFQNGQRHRLDGPAIEYTDGSKEWYQNDRLHREDGPAIDWSGGLKQWWIDGECLLEDEFKQRTKL